MDILSSVREGLRGIGEHVIKGFSKLTGVEIAEEDDEQYYYQSNNYIEDQEDSSVIIKKMYKCKGNRL